MPTGYTAALYEGKEESFATFALKCARALGYLVEMREEPLDTPIPDEFVPNDYYRNRGETKKKRLAVVKKWDEEQSKREAARAFRKDAREAEEWMRDRVEIGKRYVEIIEKIAQWTPPTPEHEGVKRFMLEQIALSLSLDSLAPVTVPSRVSGRRYKRNVLRDLRKDIAWYAQKYKEEVLSAQKASEWVRALKASL